MRSVHVYDLDSGIVIDGKRIPLPDGSSNNNITIINKDVFINGKQYIYATGEWKRTLRALYHMLF